MKNGELDKNVNNFKTKLSKKSANFHTNFCKNFEFRPVRRNVDIVDLENVEKWDLGRKNRLRYRGERARQSFSKIGGPEWECRGSSGTHGIQGLDAAGCTRGTCGALGATGELRTLHGRTLQQDPWDFWRVVSVSLPEFRARRDFKHIGFPNSN